MRGAVVYDGCERAHLREVELPHCQWQMRLDRHVGQDLPRRRNGLAVRGQGGKGTGAELIGFS